MNNYDHGYDYAEPVDENQMDDYDGLEYEEYTNVQANNEMQIIQNPYYEGQLETDSKDKSTVNFENGMMDSDTVTRIQNPYYE